MLTAVGQDVKQLVGKCHTGIARTAHDPHGVRQPRGPSAVGPAKGVGIVAFTGERIFHEEDERRRQIQRADELGGRGSVVIPHTLRASDDVKGATRCGDTALPEKAERHVYCLADRVAPVCNVVISNVPGPRETLYLAGSELRALVPVSTIGDGMGLNMTVVSYRDRLDFGYVACREQVPDLWDLIADTEAAIAELTDALVAA